MSFVVKKRDLTDPAQLQALLVEHADDMERGLTIVDSRLPVGQATIDVVGLDADSALVLIVIGLVADEEMFLRAVEAYSWCLEYPEAIRRLYPEAQLSTARPPRVMFVVERVPDAFHRKVKQLGFQEVDCVEFRHLDVDGTPAVYFENLARLRRNAATTAPTPVQSAAPTPPVANGRSTTLKLQKLLGADRGGREPAPIVRMVHRGPVRPESRPPAGAPRTEPTVPPRGGVDEPPAPRPSVDTPGATREKLPRPTARVTDRAPVSEPAPAPVSAPIASPNGTAANAVAEAVADVLDLLAPGVGASDAMVEAFVTTERPAANGHVAMSRNTLPELAPVIHDVGPEIREPEHTVEPSAPVVAAPVMPQSVIPEPESDEAAEIGLDVVAAELSGTADPMASEPTRLDEAPAVADAHEAQIEVAAISASEPELVLELERPLVEQAPESTAPATAAAAEPTVIEPEAAVAVAEPSTESSTRIVPVAMPTPAASVFARRPAESVAAPAEPKVSFAGVAKDLLPPSSRTTELQPSVSVARGSVEDIARGALDDLVGGTEKPSTDDRATAFAKPTGPFAKAPTLKRPRTIAPPASDAQPIAGGPKFATGVNQVAPPAPATEPAPTATDVAPAKAPAPTLGEVQFPNDGVLTRQWMEFLNQMAAGK
jgi:hypothetical protein